ncbi:MAG: hypothetical protein ABUT39_25140 [Acidobacteriota bacterium]
MMTELLPDDDPVLSEDDLRGKGLTAEQIAASSEVGAWADVEVSGAEYVEQLRQAAPRYHLGN